MKYILFLDFDGTLAPMAKRPDLANMPSKMKVLLKKICSHRGINVAIVSGRKLSTIRQLAGLDKAIYAGNHGLEIELKGRKWKYPGIKRIRPLMKKIKNNIQRKLKIKGAFVEDKGFTISVHYRLAFQKHAEKIKSVIKAIVNPYKRQIQLTYGKKVVEIRPSFKWNKGNAVAWIIKKLSLKDYLPIYIGDDETDEDAFKVLKGRGITIIVGRKRRTFAEYRLNNIAAVYDFLAGFTPISKRKDNK